MRPPRPEHAVCRSGPAAARRTRGVLRRTLMALAAATCGTRAAGPSAPIPPFQSPTLQFTTAWIGNTYPGRERWVPHDIDDLALAPNGRLFSNVHWEDGGGNCTEFRDGDVIGHAGHTHGWGHQGGHAVAANARDLFIAGRMGNEGGKLCDPNTWPLKGFSWIGVSRRRLSDIRAAAPFPGAKGGAGGTLSSAFLVVDEVPAESRANEDRSKNIAELVATDRRLFISCPYVGKIRVHDAETMARLAEWPLDRPGPLACRRTARCGYCGNERLARRRPWFLYRLRDVPSTRS